MTEPSPNKPTRPVTPPSRRPPGVKPPPAAAAASPASAQRQVQSSSEQRPVQRLVQRPRRRGDARISLLAVFGAAWASLFFIMLILATMRGDVLILPQIRPPLWVSIYDYIVQPLGWSAPLAVTVLGLLALGEIQKSDGEKYGLSLALFDAMLFPLLLLDFLILWLCRQGATALIQQEVMPPAVADAVLGQIVPVLAIILGDYYLATRAWSAVQPEPQQ